ncbi:MAG TPA: hypothetical protein PLI09_08780 [Candidatus Hydrogenedentes bacterium]|nr:hypothetical protein [Candidatus Hydrogenedentota bacterium]
MEVGAEYSKERLDGTRYFEALLNQLGEVPDSVLNLFRLNRSA